MDDRDDDVSTYLNVCEQIRGRARLILWENNDRTSDERWVVSQYQIRCCVRISISLAQKALEYSPICTQQILNSIETFEILYIHSLTILHVMIVRSFFIIRIVDWCFLRTVAYLFALNQAFPLFFRFQRFPKHIFSFPFDICFQSTTINFNAYLWCKEIKNRLGVSPRGSNYCQITKTKRKTISTLPLQIHYKQGIVA